MSTICGCTGRVMWTVAMMAFQKEGAIEVYVMSLKIYITHTWKMYDYASNFSGWAIYCWRCLSHSHIILPSGVSVLYNSPHFWLGSISLRKPYRARRAGPTVC